MVQETSEVDVPGRGNTMNQVERFETVEQYLEFIANRQNRDLDAVRSEYRDSTTGTSR